ncbi:uncharacterized protein LOC119631288 [Glossina fuscipes]|uniref:Uncharacterized protein LOC119631288 n=2 Tax=Nemorhina TaxID=44051 RepID=A0A8U0W288_9MUSC|nr:uncharacterized protein LOC119631288 [Glossina fuscipes]KAI9586751.1 hypothetical protein GQX74_002598 [Glossina fuscipes]
MKFFALFVVALLAVNASAYSTHTRYVRDINTEKTEIFKAYDVNAFYAAFEHFMEGLRIVCPEPVYNFFQKVYETCKRIGELVPSELPTSFYNVYAHFPTYKQFFPEEFINAVEHLFRTIKDVVVPPQIWAFVNATWENFPKITDYIKPELFNSIGAHLQKVPFVREYLKNTYMVLEQLLQHSRP